MLSEAALCGLRPPLVSSSGKQPLIQGIVERLKTIFSIWWATAISVFLYRTNLMKCALGVNLAYLAHLLFWHLSPLGFSAHVHSLLLSIFWLPPYNPHSSHGVFLLPCCSHRLPPFHLEPSGTRVPSVHCLLVINALTSRDFFYPNHCWHFSPTVTSWTCSSPLTTSENMSKHASFPAQGLPLWNSSLSSWPPVHDSHGFLDAYSLSLSSFLSCLVSVVHH